MHVQCCAESGSQNLELDSAAQNCAEELAQALVAEEKCDLGILAWEWINPWVVVQNTSVPGAQVSYPQQR